MSHITLQHINTQPDTHCAGQGTKITLLPPMHAGPALPTTPRAKHTYLHQEVQAACCSTAKEGCPEGDPTVVPLTRASAGRRQCGCEPTVTESQAHTIMHNASSSGNSSSSRCKAIHQTGRADERRGGRRRAAAGVSGRQAGRQAAVPTHFPAMGSSACASLGEKSRAGFAAMPVGPPRPRIATNTKNPIHMPASKHRCHRERQGEDEGA